MIENQLELTKVDIFLLPRIVSHCSALYHSRCTFGYSLRFCLCDRDRLIKSFYCCNQSIFTVTTSMYIYISRNKKTTPFTHVNDRTGYILQFKVKCNSFYWCQFIVMVETFASCIILAWTLVTPATVICTPWFLLLHNDALTHMHNFWPSFVLNFFSRNKIIAGCHNNSHFKNQHMITIFIQLFFISLKKNLFYFKWYFQSIK